MPHATSTNPQPAANTCPTGCTTRHPAALGDNDHTIRYGAVAARLDQVDGGTPATIAVETIHPQTGTPSIVLATGPADSIDDCIRHLTAPQAVALAARLAAAARALTEAVAR